MKIAVFADIHGNHLALERCLEHALSAGAERFFLLGDYLGELAYPRRTMELLYRLNAGAPCVFIRGNKEEYWLEHRATGSPAWRSGDSVTGALWYVYQTLQPRDLAFFEQMPRVRRVEPPGLPALTLCHGTPEAVGGRLVPEGEESREILECSETPLILCGHTHVQGKLQHAGRLALNPGAVGTPFFSGGKTQFLLLEGAGGCWKEEFVSLDYDVEQAIRELRQERLWQHAPSWTRVTESVLRGRDVSHGQVLARAMELCRRERGACHWPEVPEEYIRQAADELIGPCAPVNG